MSSVQFNLDSKWSLILELIFITIFFHFYENMLWQIFHLLDTEVLEGKRKKKNENKQMDIRDLRLESSTPAKL